eukprot:g28151.t1
MRPRQDWCSSLGAQAQKHFKHSCEEAPLMELAKWGLAVVARIVEDTHFPVYWKQVLPAISAAIKKGEPYMHQPKHKMSKRVQVDGQWVQLYVPRCLHGVRTPVCSLGFEASRGPSFSPDLDTFAPSVPRGVSTQ